MQEQISKTPQLAEEQFAEKPPSDIWRSVRLSGMGEETPRRRGELDYFA
jgi:hypothetical protein